MLNVERKMRDYGFTYADDPKSEISLHGVDELLVFLVGEIHLAGIHLECAAVVRPVHVFGSEMEMEVAELVAVSPIVDFLRIKGFLHGTGHLGHVGHERVALIVAQLIEVVHMTIVSHEATAAVGLLLKKENTRNTQFRNLNHEVVECLIVRAIETVGWIAVHSSSFCLSVLINEYAKI